MIWINLQALKDAFTKEREGGAKAADSELAEASAPSTSKPKPKPKKKNDFASDDEETDKEEQRRREELNQRKKPVAVKKRAKDSDDDDEVEEVKPKRKTAKTSWIVITLVANYSSAFDWYLWYRWTGWSSRNVTLYIQKYSIIMIALNLIAVPFSSSWCSSKVNSEFLALFKAFFLLFLDIGNFILSRFILCRRLVESSFTTSLGTQLGRASHSHCQPESDLSFAELEAQLLLVNTSISAAWTDVRGRYHCTPYLYLIHTGSSRPLRQRPTQPQMTRIVRRQSYCWRTKLGGIPGMQTQRKNDKDMDEQQRRRVDPKEEA